jgi:hypothetical protein
MKPKIHTWKLGRYQPNPEKPTRWVVDCHLREVRTTPDVWWSPSTNSYVLAEIPLIDQIHVSRRDMLYWQVDGQWVELLSINGAGEVRWNVERARVEQAQAQEEEEWGKKGDSYEFLCAARHFGLQTVPYSEDQLYPIGASNG